jgi:hypothetical protein
MTDKLENKVDYTITRAEVDNVFSRTFTDDEWTTLAGEIESIIDHYVWSDLPQIVIDLPEIMAEDAKYN